MNSFTAAFCFYNLSAIVNGLVYFDEFGLIPPLHLSLVVVGFFTLLAGVWVVSIQPGVDGVDVGSWAVGDVTPTGESEGSEVDVVDETDATVERAVEEQREVEESGRWRERLKRRETRSESNIIKTIYTSPERIGTLFGLGHPSRRRLSDSPSALSGTRRSRSASPSPPRSPLSRLSVLRRRRPTLDGHPYFTQAQTLARPLIGPSTTTTTTARPHSQVSMAGIGPGFHIGLSPLSPGFAILPRRRRVSGLGTRYQDQDGDEGEDDDGESGRRRFSEGDMGALAGLAGDEGATEAARDNTTDGKGKGKDKSARSRWGWLKRLRR